MDENNGNESQRAAETVRKKIVQRAGGRHLIFRIKNERMSLLPKPYALISNIEGSIWIFYGVGQIWITHRKLRKIRDWHVRVPRLTSKRVIEIIEKLEKDIEDFIEHVDNQGLIGTLVVERKVIEFHWTVPKAVADTQPNLDRKTVIDLQFNKLATTFAKLQLVGQEGLDDVDANQIQLQ